MADLKNIDSLDLLKELSRRGGHPGAVADAVLLCARKSEDYNQGMGHADIHSVDRSSYFPFGAVSHAQMLHTKAQRFNSLVQRVMRGEEPNYEGLRDTALDIINYAGFAAADRRLAQTKLNPCGFSDADRRFVVPDEDDLPRPSQAWSPGVQLEAAAGGPRIPCSARELELEQLLLWVMGYDVQLSGLPDFHVACEAPIGRYAWRYAWRTALRAKLESMGMKL